MVAVRQESINYIGYVDEVTRFYVSGWVADQNNWKQSFSVDVIVNDVGMGVCDANIFRDQLDKLHPEATGYYAFKFYFADPLSMYSDQEVRVRVTSSEYYLVCANPRIDSIARVSETGSHRPTAPIILSTIGRTGSTAIMGLLAQHKSIVVAGNKPYEIEMGCYYAYALRTLAAPGDHLRSLRTDNITAENNRFHIGFNPYFEPAFAAVFRDPQQLSRFLSGQVPQRIGNSFREVILDYYEAIASDKAIDNPIYFAEKSLPERDSRLGIRYMFPNMREIVLVRDLRDVVSSAVATATSGKSFDQIVADTKAGAEQICAILGERNSPHLFLRYEDFIRDPDKVIKKVFQFLGLPPQSLDMQKMNDLFAQHATSASAAASIGRWKGDLSFEQKSRCKCLAPLLHQLGYEPGSAQ